MSVSSKVKISTWIICINNRSTLFHLRTPLVNIKYKTYMYLCSLVSHRNVYFNLKLSTVSRYLASFHIIHLVIYLIIWINEISSRFMFRKWKKICQKIKMSLLSNSTNLFIFLFDPTAFVFFVFFEFFWLEFGLSGYSINLILVSFGLLFLGLFIVRIGDLAEVRLSLW